jgi:tRNA pseudouridine55 synthase
MDGVLNLDKPLGLSSAAMVARVKRLLPRGTKIGHAGTLDPFATGVLLLLIGRGTKRCEQLMDQPKQYEATVKFGATTATDDLESLEVPWASEGGQTGVKPVSLDEIHRAWPQFTGEILQRPPVYSAMKIGGRRAYQLARQGQEIKMPPRLVRVYSLEVIGFAWPNLRLRIDCGRGTYIRALARDLGAALNVGGYLTQLRRTRVGRYSVDSAVRLEELSSEIIVERLQSLESIDRNSMESQGSVREGQAGDGTAPRNEAIDNPMDHS